MMFFVGLAIGFVCGAAVMLLILWIWMRGFEYEPPRRNPTGEN